MLFFFVFLVSSLHADADPILHQLRQELELSRTEVEDRMLPYLCQLLPSKTFIDAAEDDELLSSILYELGFGVRGLRDKSWAEKFKANSRHSTACFAALHSTATSDMSRSALASSRRILWKCCKDHKELWTVSDWRTSETRLFPFRFPEPWRSTRPWYERKHSSLSHLTMKTSSYMRFHSYRGSFLGSSKNLADWFFLPLSLVRILDHSWTDLIFSLEWSY